MPDTTYNSLLNKYYDPGNIRRGYIPPLTNNSIWSVDEYSRQATILESNGKDVLYPGQWCDSIIFGGYVMEVHSELHYHDLGSIGGAFEYVNPFDNPVISEDDYMELEEPLKVAYNMSNCTHFIGGEEFGQVEGTTAPSKVEIKHISTGTQIDWYFNGSILHSDVITGRTIHDFALAVQITGVQTISNYAYIWTENGNLWTSGSYGNADVIRQILNAAGSGELGQSVTGWQDPDDPDKQFVLSKLNSIPGQYTTLSHGSANNISNGVEHFVDKQTELGSLLGTDLVTYITNIPDSAGAWDYLMNDPESDMLTMNIPSAEGHEYRIEWHYSDKNFYVYDGETQKAVTTSLNGTYKTGGCYIPIGTLDGGTALGWGLAIRTSAPYTCDYHFYFWNSDISGTETEEFDFSEGRFEYANGYDAQNPGEEDDPQPDADDIEDPSIDALSTGFVYAFDVNFSDMENLVSCLNGNTLAQKIKADFGNKLFDFIVSYHTMPCITGATEGDRTGINYMGVPFIYGADDTQLTLKKISKSWYKVDLGTKKCLPTGRRNDNGFGFEDWQSAQVQMFLPFIGTVHLNTADVWGRDIHVVYYFDVLIGSCTVDIGVEGKGTLYSYESSCSYKIPFTSVIDTSVQQMMSGVMSASSGLFTSVMGATTGNAGAVLGGVNQIVGSAGNFISAMEHKAVVNRGGSLGSSGGWHTPRSPALIITVPDYQKVDTTLYNQINGYPTHKAVQLSGYSGQYVEVAHIDLKASVNGNGATPNDTELDMIRSLLNGGVYV